MEGHVPYSNILPIIPQDKPGKNTQDLAPLML
jgi:hypothetical protein